MMSEIYFKIPQQTQETNICMFGSIKLGSSTVLLNCNYTLETHEEFVKIPKARLYPQSN